MGTRDLTISERAFAALSAVKRPGETLSDTILRLTGRSSLRDLARLLPKEEAEALAKAIGGRAKA